MDFQHRVSAWVAVRILAESDASALWGLPTGTTLESLRCETDQPVDDLLVATSLRGFIFGQVKHSTDLSEAQDSDLAAAVSQFVRQFLSSLENRRTRPWERPLDRQLDRLVLITGPTASMPIRGHLRAVLDRLRQQISGQRLEDGGVNNEERRALRILIDHAVRAWKRAVGIAPSEEKLRQLLPLIHVQVLDVDAGGADELQARDMLSTAVLRAPRQGEAAWRLLIASCARFATERSGADRDALQRILLDTGLELRAPRGYREDIERLKAYSRTTANALADLSRVSVGAAVVKIMRASTEELLQAAEAGSILVVGEPGSGKSAALYEVANNLAARDRDVVLLAADRLSAQSLAGLQGELGLSRPVADVLANWPGSRPAFLVVDALDAARADPAARALRDLFRAVLEAGSRWRVVASIRKFDLRYSPELRQLFSGEASTNFRDVEFASVRHVNVPRLSDDELTQIAPQSPALQGLVEGAPHTLRELLRVPFNLRLLAELLAVGVSTDELTPIKTQLELLDRYWLHRVIGGDAPRERDAREAVLRRVCEGMVETRMLRVDRSRVAEAQASQALHDLLSRQILIESPDRYVLGFSHHVLFDYAVARLLLRGTTRAFVQRLAQDPELALVIRPSLLLHFQHLWTLDRSRAAFWNLVLQVMRAEGISEVGKLIGPSVAADVASELSDVEPLCTALESPDAIVQRTGEEALRHLVGALLAAPPEWPLTGAGAGPWCELLERVAGHLRR
jgi:hypothetical protein